jgi:hypothetical protein
MFAFMKSGLYMFFYSIQPEFLLLERNLIPQLAEREVLILDRQVGTKKSKLRTLYSASRDSRHIPHRERGRTL